MKKILLGLLICFTLLVMFVLIRTWTFTSKQAAPAPVPLAQVDTQAVSNRLAAAVRFKTVSYEANQISDPSQFEDFHHFLQETFPLIHRHLKREIIGNYSLLYTWQGQDPKRKPVLLMAHMDVVPVERGMEQQWDHPPFSGATANGFVYGRGTLDDKGSLMGIMEAVETLLKERFQPERTLYVAFGHDEEVSGKNGAAQIVRLLQSRRIRLEYTLDEGMMVTKGIVPGVDAPVALIGLAEKGYLSLELRVHGEGGHSSMPPPSTAAGVLSEAVHRLERNPLPARLDGVAGELFQTIGPEMTFSKKMAFANLWLFGGLVKKQLESTPSGNAMIRTTTAVTMINAGTKDNVLPAQARAVVNFRILPGDTIKSVMEHVREVIDNPKISIKPLEGMGQEPSPVSSVDSWGFKTLTKTLRQVYPEALVAPSLVLAATDSRYFVPISDQVYRFTPLWVTADDLKRIHGQNERISTEHYAQAVRFYIQLIRNSGS